MALRAFRYKNGSGFLGSSSLTLQKIFSSEKYTLSEEGIFEIISFIDILILLFVTSAT